MNFSFSYLFSIILLILSPLQLIIRNRSTISLFFPDPRRRLNSLNESKKFCQKDDYEFNIFVTAEIKRANFENATGLKYTYKNQLLIEHFNLIRNQLNWKEFRRIKDKITNIGTLEILERKPLKVKSYARMGISIAFAMFAMLFIIFALLKTDYESEQVKTSTILMLFIAFGFFYATFEMYRLDYKILKKYNDIVRFKLKNEIATT